MIMACLQIYRELLSLVTFLRVHSNSNKVSYLSLQNTYPNLKTTCHIKLKFFLWTKLLENLSLKNISYIKGEGSARKNVVNFPNIFIFWKSLRHNFFISANLENLIVGKLFKIVPSQKVFLKKLSKKSVLQNLLF